MAGSIDSAMGWAGGEPSGTVASMLWSIPPLPEFSRHVCARRARRGFRSIVVILVADVLHPFNGRVALAVGFATKQTGRVALAMGLATKQTGRVTLAMGFATGSLDFARDDRGVAIV